MATLRNPLPNLEQPDWLDSVPVEAEELTQKTVAALDQARKSLARGKSISHDEILREFKDD